ncbi:MAG: NAD-dependent epimerase/dehydratase family protein [Candidatus Sulfotelmatobacter sp.]
MQHSIVIPVHNEAQNLEAYGSGEQARDFSYVDNVVIANLLACHAPAEKVAGKVFNIACGCQQSLNRLYEKLAGLIPYQEPLCYAPPRLGDIVHSQADISAATQEIGCHTRIGIPARRVV